MNKLYFGLSLVLTSACALLPAGAASAASGVVAQVDVNDNTRGVNTVGAFDRHWRPPVGALGVIRVAR